MSTKKSNSMSVDSPVIVTPSELAKNVALLGKARSFEGRSLFIWGPPGIGKSSILQQTAAAAGRVFHDLRLSQMAPEDIRGVPYKTSIHNFETVLFSEPYDLPHDIDYKVEVTIKARKTEIEFHNPDGYTYRTGRRPDGQPIYSDLPKVTVKALEDGQTAKVSDVTLNSFCVTLTDDKTGEIIAGEIQWKVEAHANAILALEEFNSAPPSVQTAAYQLVLDRRVGNYRVPQDVQIVALGNRESDRGVTFKQPLPIANRFVHLELTSHGAALYKDWFDWAIEKGIHQFVVGYLEHYKDRIFQFDAATVNRAFPTPRSWEMVSDILNVSKDVNEARSLIYGSIGDGTASDFVTFCSLAEHLPKASDILAGNVTKLTHEAKDQGTALTYSLAVSLCYEMQARHIASTKEQNANTKADMSKAWLADSNLALVFMMNNFQEEIVIMAIKMALTKYKLPFDRRHQPAFSEFSNKYKKYILGGTVN